MICIFFSAIDLSIGKVDKNSLSPQILMELFVESFENRSVVCGEGDDSLDIASWKGVKLSETDEVIEVQWNSRDLVGSVSLEWLPPTVQNLTLNGSVLSGTLDFSCLSEGIIYIDLSCNKFSGAVSLSSLPNTVQAITIYKNRLSGFLDLTDLPDSLKELSAFENLFTGNVCLTNLPSGMTGLWIHKNKFSGSIDLSQFPEQLAYLNLSTNDFYGETDFTKLPKSMKGFDVSFTQIAGVAYKRNHQNILYFGYTGSQVEYHL